MKKPDELLNYLEWDVRNWSVALDFWLANTAKRLSGCKVLEIGSNLGGLSYWFATQGAQIVHSNIDRVKEEAIEKHKRAGLSHLIEYEVIDARDIPYEDHFDIVVFKSVLGGVGDGDKDAQELAIAQMHKALKPGGELFFAENAVASPLHMFLRRKMIKWGNTWRYVTIGEMREFLSPFSRSEFCSIGFAGTFGRTEAQRDLLALTDKYLFEHIMPDAWKYIIAGVARK